MAVAPLGLLDLSLVTNTLISLLEQYVSTASPLWQSLEASGNKFTINYSGAFPDAMRKEAGCQLTFTLFHATEDKYQRNSPLLGQRAQTIPFQPLSLDLYYLLTAFADQQYQQEQQAMSMAMQFFYQTPIVGIQVALPGIPGAVAQEFVLSMEIETSDELARLWQAITVPMRLSVIYKISVVLMTPPATPVLATKATTMRLLSDPTTFPYASDGQVVGTTRTASFPSLASTVANPVILSVDYSPAVAVPGPKNPFYLYGANLNSPTSNQVYLLLADGTEFNVSNWMVPETNPPAPNLQTSSRITLQLPAKVGPPPAGAPAPGIYQLRAGSDTPPSYRTNATPFSVAAWIDTSSVPSPNPPILVPSAGTYTIAGEGFAAGLTEILMDTILLDATVVSVVSAEKITFTVPAAVHAGTYSLRVRVNSVESPPAWWVVIP